MIKAAEKKSNDPLVGYFASVAIALIVCGVFARALISILGFGFPTLDSDVWQINLAAGFFIAIAFSNPVGAHLTDSGWVRSLIRIPIGFIAGVLIQSLALTPLAGNAMSNFMLLLIAGAAVPGILMVGWLRKFLDRKGILPADRLANLVLRVLSWPDRILFVLLMGTSFVLFWKFSATPLQVMIVLATVLVTLTYLVTTGRVSGLRDDNPEELERQAWLELDPDQEATTIELAIARVNRMVQTLLPGAILFGGFTRLAAEFLFIVYPEMNIDFSDPAGAAQSIAVATASGLAVILFGMMGALGFCLLVIQLIGNYKGWSRSYLKMNYVRMIRAMYFRPMNNA